MIPEDHDQGPESGAEEALGITTPRWVRPPRKTPPAALYRSIRTVKVDLDSLAVEPPTGRPRVLGAAPPHWDAGRPVVPGTHRSGRLHLLAGHALVAAARTRARLWGGPAVVIVQVAVLVPVEAYPIGLAVEVVEESRSMLPLVLARVLVRQAILEVTAGAAQ